MTDQSDDGPTTGEDQPPIESPDTAEAGHADREESAPHSSLVGLMSVPVHRRFPIRRSTLLMAVAFLGFGTLCYLYPPGAGGTVINTPNGTYFIPNGTSVANTTTTTSTTTTRPPATTTIVRSPTSSTTTSTTTSTRPTTTTTSSTTTSSGSSTTTVKGQPGTTTTIGSVGTTTTTTTTTTVP
jgi:hypothetical protein